MIVTSSLLAGSDREQSLATKQLSKIKTPLKEAIEDGMPGLTICGGYQFLGTKYITPDGTELEGLGILDFILNLEKTD